MSLRDTIPHISSPSWKETFFFLLAFENFLNVCAVFVPFCTSQGDTDCLVLFVLLKAVIEAEEFKNEQDDSVLLGGPRDDGVESVGWCVLEIVGKDGEFLLAVALTEKFSFCGKEYRKTKAGFFLFISVNAFMILFYLELGREEEKETDFGKNMTQATAKKIR